MEENLLVSNRNQILNVLFNNLKITAFSNNSIKGLITFTNDGAVCCVSANLSEVDCRRRVLDFKVLKPRDCMKTESNSIIFTSHFKFL